VKLSPDDSYDEPRDVSLTKCGLNNRRVHITRGKPEKHTSKKNTGTPNKKKLQTFLPLAVMRRH
jgi:hypothetical protein